MPPPPHSTAMAHDTRRPSRRATSEPPSDCGGRARRCHAALSRALLPRAVSRRGTGSWISRTPSTQQPQGGFAAHNSGGRVWAIALVRHRRHRAGSGRLLRHHSARQLHAGGSTNVIVSETAGPLLLSERGRVSEQPSSFRTVQWWLHARSGAVQRQRDRSFGKTEEQLSNVVDLAMKNDQAATLSSVIPSSWLSSSVTLMPSLNFAPSRTSATSWWPLNRRQRSWADSSSL